MITPIHTITITRLGHTFDIAVTDEGNIAYRVDCGKWDRAKLGNDGTPELNPAVRFDCPVILPANGEEKKCGGLRITPEQSGELAELCKKQKTAISDAIYEQARKRENDYILSVDTVLYDGGLEITAWRRYSNGDYCQAMSHIPITLRDLCRSDIPKTEMVYAGHSYTMLHPITAEQCDDLIKLDVERRAAREEAERRTEEEYQREKTELLSKVDSWEVDEEEITDEGGRTHLYTHTFRVGGEILTYTERNVFDFGRVINPAYRIADDIDGAMLNPENGVYYWTHYGYNIRELTPAENACVTIIIKYGKYAKSRIRM